MSHDRHMLKSNSFRAQDIHIHQDLLCTAPSALSRKRERKPGTELQKEKEDKAGYAGCILCHPDVKKQKNPAGTVQKISIPGKVSSFLNDYPYLPHEHRLYFLWTADQQIRQAACHKYKIDDFGPIEMYWLMRACREDARKFRLPPESADRLRLIAGFNIGDLAGQSVAHFHLQSGWEVVLQPREFTEPELSLYFRELRSEDLIIFENEHYQLVAPWTPGGKYAVDFYFRGKNEITHLTDEDLKTFAVIGDAIMRIYHNYLGITNVNIVMRGSVKDCRTEPLQMHFVPRVNLAAMYEILGVNVVDTFPQSIAAEFRRAHVDPNRGVLLPWYELFESVHRSIPKLPFTSGLPRRLFRTVGRARRHRSTRLRHSGNIRFCHRTHQKKTFERRSFGVRLHRETFDLTQQLKRDPWKFELESDKPGLVKLPKVKTGKANLSRSKDSVAGLGSTPHGCLLYLPIGTNSRALHKYVRKAKSNVI